MMLMLTVTDRLILMETPCFPDLLGGWVVVVVVIDLCPW